MEAFEKLNLDPNEVYMLVHSGSRTLGETVLGNFMEKTRNSKSKGATIGSEEFKEYLEGHDLALNFAKKNRFLIAHRILKQIDSRK